MAVASQPSTVGRAFRSWPGDISGCTSRGWAPTATTTRSRSSPAARAATSTTSTATATSTASPPSSASTPATAAPSSARRPPRQIEELDFYTLWSYAHPRAIELAARIAALAPGDLNRVFFTSGGSEAVESALKLAAQLPPHARQRPEAQGDRPRDRLPRHLAGALSATGITDLRAQFEPLAARRLPRPQHQRLPLARGPRPALGGRRDRGADRVRGPRDGRRGDPRAGAERRRLLRPARRLLPAGARDLRPPRRAADLRRGDLRVGPPRPLLRLRALRLPARHHHDGEGAHLAPTRRWAR